jgi:hypothetical protein
MAAHVDLGEHLLLLARLHDDVSVLISRPSHPTASNAARAGRASVFLAGLRVEAVENPLESGM